MNKPPPENSAKPDGQEPFLPTSRVGPAPRVALALIGAAGIVTLLLAGPVDYAWTRAVATHTDTWFVVVMANSIFEGESPGAGDVALLYLACAVVLYILSWRTGSPSWIRRLRPRLGYIVTTGLMTGLYTVHSLKWILGRARPRSVYKGHFDFSHWYEMGPQFVADGPFRGSFPSGHTACAFMFMALAYALAGSRGRPATRLAGFALGVISLSYAAAMGLARMMASAHWLTDVVGVIALNWFLMHAIYYWGLRIPDQETYVQRTGTPPPVRFLLEVRICWHMFLVCLGIMGVCIGIRALLMRNAPWLIVLSPVGVILLVAGSRRLHKLGFLQTRGPALKQAS